MHVLPVKPGKPTVSYSYVCSRNRLLGATCSTNKLGVKCLKNKTTNKQWKGWLDSEICRGQS